MVTDMPDFFKKLFDESQNFEDMFKAANTKCKDCMMFMNGHCLAGATENSSKCVLKDVK